MSDKKPKFYDIGSVMLAKKKNENDPDEVRKPYIKLQQAKKKDGSIVGDQIFPITLANGVVLKDGDMLTLKNKKEKLQALVNDAKMTQDTADYLSSFIFYDITAVVRDDGDNGSGEVPF